MYSLQHWLLSKPSRHWLCNLQRWKIHVCHCKLNMQPVLPRRLFWVHRLRVHSMQCWFLPGCVRGEPLRALPRGGGRGHNGSEPVHVMLAGDLPDRVGHQRLPVLHCGHVPEPLWEDQLQWL